MSTDSARHLTNAASVNIRRASGGDEASLDALVAAHAAFEGSSAATANLTTTSLGASILRLQAEERLWCWLAVDHEDASVGYASATEDVATFTARPFGHMDCLYVTDTWRGAGIGRDLMRAVAAWSRSRGHAELQWQTPRWNSKADGFYRSQGATALEKIRFRLALEP